jgi:type IV secretory pathway VirD2 relaxase
MAGDRFFSTRVQFIPVGTSARRWEKWKDDPHHFRFIVSPERAIDLDLTEYTRAVMKEVERSLGTAATWFAGAPLSTATLMFTSPCEA